MRVLPRFGGRRIGSKFVVALAQVPNERMPSDYAAAESFFATLKNEMYYRYRFPTRNRA